MLVNLELELDYKMDNDLNAARIKANDAKALLSNPILKEAFEKVRIYLSDKSLSCDPDNEKMTQRIILSQQIFASIEREIFRIIQDGEVAEFRIEELEKRNKLAIFRR